MVGAIGCVLLSYGTASAETLAEALAAAYSNNPTLNAQRAALRATDEGVPQALAGFRPTVSGSADVGYSTGTSSSGSAAGYPRGVSLSIVQPIFTGGRTAAGVKIAETAVLAGRETLRSTEQSTLLAAVKAFMDLVQAQALLNLRNENVDFLGQQVRAAKDRLNVGEGTRTDVAQTNARLAAGQADYNAAVAALNSALAVYEQVIGHRPKSLGAAKPIDALLSRSLNAAIADALTRHPSILAAGYNIDIAEYNVKVVEGSLLPTVSLSGTVSHRDDTSLPGTWQDSATAMAKLTVPIYSGGLTASKVRQAKEAFGQAQIQLDVARDTIRQAVISAWGQLDAARAQIRAAQAQVSAENLVLSGVIEQQKVGQSTTLDVLNAQQDLLNARVALISAQHDRVIAAYSLLAAIGKLDAKVIGLNVQTYDPTDHYKKVRDKWGGLRTPDGR